MLEPIDFDIEASRATRPYFYHSDHPKDCEPFAYQEAAVEYMLARDNGLFGDAPGLGKTVECTLLDNAIEAKKTLVLCPASLRLNWEREIRIWSTRQRVSTYPVLKSSDGISLIHGFVIISYALLANKSLVDALLDGYWDHLILDEAHALKDPKGNVRTRVICAPDMLPSVVGRITMASGSILPNQPIECYNAARLLDWDSIDRASLEDFRETYYAEGGGYVRTPHQVKLEDGSIVTRTELHWSSKVRNIPINMDDLQQRLRKHIMVRRLKEHVMPQLPQRQWHFFPIEQTKDIRKVLKGDAWTEVEKLYELDPDNFDAHVPIDGAVATARRELGEAKAPLIAEYIEELLREGVAKLIVGAWHLSVLAYLRERLNVGRMYMDGSTSSKRKQEIVDLFQSDDRYPIILGQMMPLGEGWTLTAAQDVVFVEPDWVPGKNDQLLDRVHRIGQQGTYVLGHVPIVPGTLDERILSVIARKDRAIYEALDKET